jgi:hypothetical protein
VRRSGTPEQKLDASAAFTRSRAAVEKAKADAVGADAGVRDAHHRLGAVAQALSNARQEQAKAVAEAKAKAEEVRVAAEVREIEAEAERMLKDPIYRAMKRGDLAIGMTLEQANKSQKSEGRVIEQSGDETLYEWTSYIDFQSKTITSRMRAWVRRGKIVSWHKGPTTSS